MEFRNLAHVEDRVRAWSTQLPTSIDVVAGVPRSGMVPAMLLALQRNIPVTTVELLLEGRVIGHGSTRPLAAGQGVDLATDAVTVLVVDDTVSTGGTLREVRARIEQAGLPHTVLYGAVYGDPDAPGVDFVAEQLPEPQVFSWNALHHGMLQFAAVDLDGVLCQDPTPADIATEEDYRRFIADARPRYVPWSRIGWIVTARLERYREETERWLKQHGIEYGELLMIDGHDEQSRDRLGLHGIHKASVYRRIDASLFVESDIRQAVEIAELARRPVLCIDTMQMIRPGGPRLPDSVTDVSVTRSLSRLAGRRLPPSVVRWLRAARARARARRHG